MSGAILDSFEEGQGTVRLRDRASPALGGLRRNAQRIREELERKLERLLDGAHIAPHLQDRFFTQREERYVVPIRVDARSQVRGIVHGTSQSGQTVFVEPEEIWSTSTTASSSPSSRSPRRSGASWPSCRGWSRRRCRASTPTSRCWPSSTSSTPGAAVDRPARDARPS